MKKIIFGWLIFLTMPLTVLGYAEIIEAIDPQIAIQILLFTFSLCVVGFQFIMTCTLIIEGWKEQGLKNPF